MYFRVKSIANLKADDPKTDKSRRSIADRLKQMNLKADDPGWNQTKYGESG